MSIFYIDNMYYISNENDTFFVNRFEKDHKNNIIKVIPTEEWKQLHNGSNFEKDIFYELKKPINRKYLYYESYFDFLLNFISGIF
jgi:hypothetical protein